MRLPRLSSRKVTRTPEQLLSKLYRILATDLGLDEEKSVIHAHGLLSSGKYASFLSKTGSWGLQQYASPREHLAWNQMSCLLKKFPFVDPSIDREAAAMKKFFAAEHVCKRVNARFRARRTVPARYLPHVGILDAARKYIRRVIGNSPDLPRVLSRCDFGPGASIGTHGSATHSAAKLDGPWTVTPTCAPYALYAMRRNPQIWEYLSGTDMVCYDPALFQGWFDARKKYVESNKIVCVPKTALVHRTIAIEPLLNGYVQKGVDLYLRERLRAFGTDLSDQTRNQNLAYAGSMGGFNAFSTIDLSSASDTISQEIVKELLPAEWYNFLNRIRSPSFTVGKSEKRYEKFTSMGNGFCFPLETLIFQSLVVAVYAETGDSEFAVYGDDIIVRQGSALYLIEVLKYCGFSTNVEKTFIYGPFRESCGADYFEGVPVRPYYIDEIPVNWDDIFKWLNGIRTKFGYCKSWEYLFSEVPPDWRFTRPYPGDDTSITVELDEHMRSPYAYFDRNIQNWGFARVVRTAVADVSRVYTPAQQMYGLLRGAVSDDYLPQFALRRKTRTRLCLST